MPNEPRFHKTIHPNPTLAKIMAKKKATQKNTTAAEPKTNQMRVVREAPKGTRGIRELVWVHRDDLEQRKNPLNWRKHPKRQMEALENTLEQNGWAGACLFNTKTGNLIDGHARTEVDFKNMPPWVPVLVGEWEPEQEKHILLTLDPIAAMADEDARMLKALVDDVTAATEETLGQLEESHGANQLLDTLHNEAAIMDPVGNPDYELMGGYDDDDSTLLDNTEVERQEANRRVKCPTCGQLAPIAVLSSVAKSESPESTPKESSEEPE